MVQAGVSYTRGREGSSQYGESLAGVRDETPKHQFDAYEAVRYQLLAELLKSAHWNSGALLKTDRLSRF